MSPAEGILIKRAMQRFWSSEDIPDHVLTQYVDALDDLDGRYVLAAIEAESADGARFAPTMGQLRKRVAALEIGVPDWGLARTILLAWRDGCRRFEGERERIGREWVCPDGRCDGETWIWIDDNSTTPCSCQPKLIAAQKGTNALPPVFAQFIAEYGASPMDLDAIVSDTTVEAQVRTRWDHFAARLVRDRSLSAIDNPGLPGLEAAVHRDRARSRTPHRLNPLAALKGLRPGGAS